MYDVEMTLIDGTVMTMYGFKNVLDAIHDVGVTFEDFPNLMFDRIEIVYHSYNEESDTQTEGE